MKNIWFTKMTPDQRERSFKAVIRKQRFEYCIFQHFTGKKKKAGARRKRKVRVKRVHKNKYSKE